MQRSLIGGKKISMPLWCLFDIFCILMHVLFSLETVLYGRKKYGFCLLDWKSVYTFTQFAWFGYKRKKMMLGVIARWAYTDDLSCRGQAHVSSCRLNLSLAKYLLICSGKKVVCGILPHIQFGRLFISFTDWWICCFLAETDCV